MFCSVVLNAYKTISLFSAKWEIQVYITFAELEIKQQESDTITWNKRLFFFYHH